MSLFPLNWKPNEDFLHIHTLDAHTGGEPLRIILSGLPDIPGKTILEKRQYFSTNLDYIRKALMWEPRGHADMYGAVLTEAVTDDGDFGVFFLHNEGYSTMCGHAIIALGKILPNTGMVQKEGSKITLKIDTPAGRVAVTAIREEHIVQEVTFQNVPSFVYALNKEVEVQGIGTVGFDIAFGGAFYAYCDADKLGLDLSASNSSQLIDWGRKIKNAVASNIEIKHPLEEDLSFLYGTIFVGKAYHKAHHSRNVCVFADGEVDRSPTGTGVSGRAALHFAKKEMGLGDQFTIESIIGSTMTVGIRETIQFEGYEAIVPEVSGTAYITGIHQFLIDPEDPWREGFLLR